MAPKKQQKMSIGDFLSDQSLGSWADEMDTQPLPSSGAGYGGERRTFGSAGGFGDRSGGAFGASRGGFEDRPRPFRDNLPLPDRPPYTAHLGNLSFDVTEGDIQDFLSGCEVTSVRIVEDKLEHKPKGFGYVEFGTVDGLKKAIALHESQFQGRSIRISIAEPSKDRQDGRETRELNDWTRKGPLPDLPGQGVRRTSERGPGAFGGARGFDPAAENALGERSSSRRGLPETDGKPRDFGNWERKGPLSPPAGQEPRQGGRGSRDFGQARDRRASPSWGEGRSDAGSRPPAREGAERPERAERAPPVPSAADMDSQWRSRMKPDAPSPVSTPDASSTPASPSIPASAAPPKPAERPRLNLAKRTISEAPPADSPSSSSDSKASPFGAARPIDTAAREKAIEEKHQLALRQKKDADDKAREEKKARDAEKSAAAAAARPAAPTDAATNGAQEQSADTGKQYEILRRDADEVAEDHDAPDADLNGTVVADKDTKPQEVTRVVAGGDSWRKGNAAAPAASPAPAAEGTAEELEDDGFTVVVGAGRKKGKSAGGRALAS